MKLRSLILFSIVTCSIFPLRLPADRDAYETSHEIKFIFDLDVTLSYLGRGNDPTGLPW